MPWLPYFLRYIFINMAFRVKSKCWRISKLIIKEKSIKHFINMWVLLWLILLDSIAVTVDVGFLVSSAISVSSVLELMGGKCTMLINYTLCIFWDSRHQTLFISLHAYNNTHVCTHRHSCACTHTYTHCRTSTLKPV